MKPARGDDTRPWTQAPADFAQLIQKDKITKKAGPKNRTMKGAPAKNVGAYLASVPRGTRVVLEKLRRTIKAAAPKAEEVISYQIPGYKYNGMLIFFAAFKNHCSLFGVSKSVIKTFSRELKPHEISGTTIHFSADHPLPASLVTRIVKARMKENEARAKNKQHN